MASKVWCRLLAVALVMVFWIGAFWYVRVLPASSGDLVGLNFQQNLVFKNKSSILYDEQLTDDLIGEVVEELQKIRKEALISNHSEELPCDGVSRTEPQQRETVGHGLLQQPVGHSLHSFMLTSVYRSSLSEFYVIGLVSVELRQKQGQPIHSCAWVPKASSASVACEQAAKNSSHVVWGSVLVRYVNETAQNAAYDVSVAKCSFVDPVGANAEGGWLLLNATAAASYEFAAIFQEQADEVMSIQFEGPFRFDYAYCSPPISGNLSTKYVREWLMYHQSLWDGKIHYIMYDAGGINSRLLRLFSPLIRSKLLTIVDMKSLTTKFFSSPSSSSSSDRGGLRQLAINDCLQRTKFLATWSFFWDLDEYFQLVREYSSIAALLQKHENAPWISLGNMIWSRTYCAQPSPSPSSKSAAASAAAAGEEAEKWGEEEWAIERMCFRLGRPTCGEARRAGVCHGAEGQRKWMGNPRKVVMGTVHRTLDPEWNGVILDAAIARLNHYPELSLSYALEEKNCLILKNPDEHNESTVVDGWWWRDVSFSQTARRARQYSKSLAIFRAADV